MDQNAGPTQTKPRQPKKRPHMEPRGIQVSPTKGAYVGSLQGYKKYALYTVDGGKFDVLATFDGVEEAVNVAVLLESLAAAGSSTITMHDEENA